MSEHHATISWRRQGDGFLQGKYSRQHEWKFDGGLTVPASPSPSVVPEPWSNPANVDPEEAFVAAISSCHMLTFLWLASKVGFQADVYEDKAFGVMSKTEDGKPWISAVSLRPRVSWSGAKQPSDSEIEQLHHEAHDRCFIANSVKTLVTVGQPVE